MSRTLIIGASHAGSQAVMSLRQNGYTGEVVLIGDEAELPYHRPPLSKTYMLGGTTMADIALRPETAYTAADVTLRRAVRVEAIDPTAQSVTTTTGEVLDYDHLILATGARVRRLPVPGEDLPGVYYLRDASDARTLQAAVQMARSAVIIGGGYIGLETAASLRKAGLDVTVLEAAPRILARVTAPEMSEIYLRIHREEGVDILESAMASKIVQTELGLSVDVQNGASMTADLVIIGIGVIPNIELAETAGLVVGNGIEVDENCQTSDPNIYAIGDVSWQHNPIYDRPMRIESVPNALDQAKRVAAHICGRPVPAPAVPWFWSDQFDLKLQIAGLSQGYDDLILRGDADIGRQVAAFYFKGDQFLAVDAINDPRSFMTGRMALSKGKMFDKAVLADGAADLKSALL